MPSSSSDSESYREYDVFLSFRGPDTRHGFTGKLYSALTNKAIVTFMDGQELQKGAGLAPAILGAIERSRISIVVFSENYANSGWCLNELVKIMECRRNNSQLVLPIFYDVDPSDVRYQKGAFGGGLERISRRTEASVLSAWKTALTDAANLSGFDLRNSQYDTELIENIVTDVIQKLDQASLPFSITNFLVGLESSAQDVIQLLKRKSYEAFVLGIWGMGGSGKSTLAKVIYRQIHHEFVYKSFLANIREAWDTYRDRIVLQKQLYCDILNEKKMKIDSIESGRVKIKERLCRLKSLVVLDDVNKDEQLQALCGNRSWIGPGSVIIITTRDLKLLDLLQPDHVFRTKEMGDGESLELFKWHAFKEETPSEDFLELSRSVVSYCGGLPLALEVLGSYLSSRPRQEWTSTLSKLKMIPNDQVQDKLRISFDSLSDDTEKDIFLDICCFFIGKNRVDVTQILDGCGLYAEIGIKTLIERSLVKIEKNNKLGMHDLLRDMGREIIRLESPKEPEKRSRLWLHKDVLDILTEHNQETKATERLSFKLETSNRLCFSTRAFEKMKRLRLLQLDQVHLIGNYGCIPKCLRWVYWQGFPLEYIPDNFYQENLVALDLRHSNLKLVWKKPQVLQWLKILNLSHSRDLTNTPDFSELPNLEKLILKDCPSLSKVHQSIGDLKNLLLLNLKDCTSLGNLPRSFYKLKSMKTLIISGCSKIDKLEEDIEQMESMTTLIAKDTAIKQVPFSIARLKSIGYISLCGYEGFSFDVIPSLIWSWMSPNMNPQSFIRRFDGMPSSAVSMHIDSKNLGDLSSMLSNLSNLRCVWVQCHSEFQLTQDFRRILDFLHDVNETELEQISMHPLSSLLIGLESCSELINIVRNNISQSQGLTDSGLSDIFLPGDNYPCWLTYTGEGHSVLFEVPQVRDCCLKGMMLCVVYSSTPANMADECLIGVLIVNYTKCLIQLYKRDTVSSLNDEEWQEIASNLEPHDKVEIFVVFGHRLTVRKMVLYLLYGESADGEMEPSLRPTTVEKMLSEPVGTEPTMSTKPDQTANRKNFWSRCNCFGQTK